MFNFVYYLAYLTTFLLFGLKTLPMQFLHFTLPSVIFLASALTFVWHLLHTNMFLNNLFCAAAIFVAIFVLFYFFNDYLGLYFFIQFMHNPYSWLHATKFCLFCALLFIYFSYHHANLLIIFLPSTFQYSTFLFS